MMLGGLDLRRLANEDERAAARTAAVETARTLTAALRAAVPTPAAVTETSMIPNLAAQAKARAELQATRAARMIAAQVANAVTDAVLAALPDPREAKPSSLSAIANAGHLASRAAVLAGKTPDEVAEAVRLAVEGK